MKNFEIIEKYLTGRMSDTERRAFENRLKNDIELSREKDEIEQLIIGIESKGLKEKLSNKSISEQSKVVPIKRKNNFNKWSMAASFLLLMLCGYWFFDSQLNDGEDILGSAFYTDPGLPTPMSNVGNYNFYDAMVDYKAEKYQLAIDKWSNAQSPVGPDTIGYYTGMAHLNLNQWQKAKQKLNIIPPKSSFYNRAQWYLIKIAIEEEDYSKAKQILNKLPENVDEHYHEIQDYLISK